jgi:glycosyltransferase involved in cell wall biosynthesis
VICHSVLPPDAPLTRTLLSRVDTVIVHSAAQAARPGYLPADQIPALFAAADALVLPYREATGSQNVLLAFSFGVPVLSTTAGGLAEAVRDGVDALTCAPGDVADLARAPNEIAVPATAARLRAGVRAVDPEPYWAAYLRVLQAG